MSDLISRSALIEDLDKKSSYDLVCFDVELLGIINDQPAIEAVPVVHGSWNHTGYDNEWECSNCKSQMELSDDVNSHPNFCGNCGADMRNLKET